MKQYGNDKAASLESKKAAKIREQFATITFIDSGRFVRKKMNTKLKLKPARTMIVS